MNPQTGKFLIAAGVVLIIVGIILVFKINIPWIGRLPGDIYIKRENVAFYFPLATSVVLSILISLILYLFRKP